MKERMRKPPTLVRRGRNARARDTTQEKSWDRGVLDPWASSCWLGRGPVMDSRWPALADWARAWWCETFSWRRPVGCWLLSPWICATPAAASHAPRLRRAKKCGRKDLAGRCSVFNAGSVSSFLGYLFFPGPPPQPILPII